MKKKIFEKKDPRLEKWQGKYEDAKLKYADERESIDRREGYYNGNRAIYSPDGQQASRGASNIRNICFELIETEVDTTVPMPRVTPLHAEDKEVSRKLEALLRSESTRLHLDEMNDLQERITAVTGSDFWLVEWDPSAGYHCNVGDVSVTELHPKQVIPQPGVYRVEDMDYYFVVTSKSKDAIKRQFGKDVSTVSETDPTIRANSDGKDTNPIDDIVTQIDCYYRNGSGGVGLISWAEDVLLRDDADYQSRKLERCTKCGRIKTDDICPECGGKTFKKDEINGYEIDEDITAISDGGSEVTIPAEQDGDPVYATNPDGSYQYAVDDEQNTILGEDGTPQRIQVSTTRKKTKIPYFKPNCFPLVERRNISRYGSFLGLSDIDPIADQQEAIKKFGSKIDEKILKGGSFITLPSGVDIETTDRDFKIARLDNDQQKSLISVINVQPDISKEQTQLEMNYQWAKSTIGITDSFQGKADTSATSGTAKQFAANQSAGRLMSKRKMKYASYARLYQMMFYFLMAYSDDPIPYQTTDENGQPVFAHFDPKELLKVDAAGVPYWNTEFQFSVDESATIASNRETLWNMADVKFQSGAFGPINDLQSAAILWTWLEATGYPGAGPVKKNIDERLAVQQQQLAEQSSASSGVPSDGVDNRTTVQASDLTNLPAGRGGAL